MADVHIPAEIIEGVVARITAMNQEDLRALMRRSGSLQPELTGFVAGATYDCSAAARALATICMVAAYEACRAGYVKTRKARERLVRKWFDEARQFTLELSDEFRTVESAVEDGPISSEPHLMEALLDLAFSDDGRSSVALDEDEGWHLFAVLYTLVETLHECAGAPRFDSPAAEHGGEAEGAESEIPIVVGLAWYTPEQWQRMRDTAEDSPEDLDESYRDWLARGRIGRG